MALYRRGTASMDADGTVHGTDTKWKDQLALIRVGATIVFLEQPIKLAVISDIVSDTELKAISTDGQTAADGKYVILLNDSLTVNGLAQNVAETLRYYQSKETEIAGAMDIIADLGMDNLNRIVEEIKANKSAAESAQNQSELARDAANAARDETNSIKNQTQQIVDGAVDSINAAKDQAITNIGSKESSVISHIDTEEAAAIQAINDAKGDLSGYVNDAQTAAQTATSAKNDAQVARDNAVSAKDAAAVSAQEAKDAANSVNAENLLTKSDNLAGLADLPTSRTNVGLGDADNVTHQSLHLKLNGTAYGGGMESHRNDAGGALLTKSTFNNELVDGKSTTSISTGNHEAAKTAYLTYNEDGLLSGPSEVRASSMVKVRGNASPKISLTNDTIESSSMRHNMSLELNDDGIVRLYRRANDGNGTFQRLEFPQIEGVEGADTSLALKGGLMWNGDDVWLGNFDDIAQGWSYVAGNPANGPVTDTYGSCFSYCSQGLKEGSLPGSYNPKDVWWRQIYYTTGNVTYSRVNTNKGGWQPWSEYTMSAVSDERLKDVLGNLNVEGALDNINRMDFKLFRFKEERDQNKEPTVRRGVISQQIRGIDKEYTKLIGGYYHLDRTPMLLDGLAAIKALRARDEQNKERIADLESRLSALEVLVNRLIENK
ncbi:lateral tail fiber protein [Escherichia phage LeonhardEuler]|uniref:Lateral tail fiber protein n=2 Tax=root TaxID=1 RepID=A0AAE8B2W8_9CAUD|nr:lateral tail fiber protein [Escherichia phage LeonhardEuler]